MLRRPWPQPPPEPAVPNYGLLGADALVWTGAHHQLIAGRGRLQGVDASGTPRPGAALGRSWTRAASAGTTFGASSPLNLGATVLVVAAPVASANRKVAFSQRISTSNAAQWACGFNIDASITAASGSMALTGRNTGATFGGVQALSQVDGALHCWVAGNDSTASTGYIYRDGVSQALTANVRTAGTIAVAGQIIRVGNIGDYSADGSFVCDDPIYLIVAWPRLLEADQAQRLSALLLSNPGLALEARRVWMPAPSSVSVTGALAATNADDTSNSSGTTTVTGTLARTNANDTSAAAGTTTVVGSLARTNDADTSAASGAVGGPVSGTLAKTNANDTSAASGTTTVVGSSAPTNASDTSAASGVAGPITGTLARTNANDTVSASGVVQINGSTGAVVYLPMRFASGRWTTTGVTAGSDLTSARSLLPPQRQQFGTAIVGGKPVPIYVDGSTWYRYFDFLANVQLGGLQGLTLQDVIDAVIAAQENMQSATAAAAAVGQQTQANADALAAAVQVIQTAALPGSDQIPPVQQGLEIP